VTAPGSAPQADVPAPPPGPGVAAPFAAPPRDRDNKSLWIGLGAGGLLLVLCCVGGIFGIGLLASGGEELVRSQATAVVGTYLEALRKESYPEAYDLLCSDVTSSLSLEGFEARMSDPPLVAYRIDSVALDQDLVVSATIQRDGRSSENVNYPLVQSGSLLKICGGV
jgi:hypothetical protein